MTTNERLNYSRYAYFGHRRGDSGTQKKKKHVFNRSVFQNCVDFFELKCFRSYKKVDWIRTYASISSHNDDFHNHHQDAQNPLIKDKDNYQYV